MPRIKKDYSEVVLAYLKGNGKFVSKSKIAHDLQISSHGLSKALRTLRKEKKIGRMCSYPKEIEKGIRTIPKKAHIYFGVI